MKGSLNYSYFESLPTFKFTCVFIEKFFDYEKRMFFTRFYIFHESKDHGSDSCFITELLENQFRENRQQCRSTV